MPTHREVEVVRLLLLPAHRVVPQLVRALGHALPARAVVHDLGVVADLRVHVKHQGRGAGEGAQTSPDKGVTYISISRYRYYSPRPLYYNFSYNSNHHCPQHCNPQNLPDTRQQV